MEENRNKALWNALTSDIKAESEANKMLNSKEGQDFLKRLYHIDEETEKQYAEIRELSKPTCPLCKSKNIQDNSTYEDNGTIGWGYKRWKTNDSLYCGDCGIIFKDIRSK